MANFTPDQLAAEYLRRAAEVPKAAARGMRNALTAVDRQAVQNLSGTGTPGSYPVPIRTGNLRRGQGSRRIGETAGIVFNRVAYARAIHEGMRPYGNRFARWTTGRPWLELAAESVNVLEIIAKPIRKALGLQP